MGRADPSHPEPVVHVLVVEQRQQASDGDGAEQRSLRVDDGNIRVLPLHRAQRRCFGVVIRQHLHGAVSLQAVQPRIRRRGQQCLDRHLADEP